MDAKFEMNFCVITGNSCTGNQMWLESKFVFSGL